MLSKMTRHAKESFKTRPKRVIPADLATAEAIGGWKLQSTYSAHQTAHPRVNALRISARSPDLVLSGGEDGQVLLFDAAQQRVERRFEGHSKPVSAVLLAEAGAGAARVVVSASLDRTVRVWRGGGAGAGLSRRGAGDDPARALGGGDGARAAAHRGLLRLLRARRALGVLRPGGGAAGAERARRAWARGARVRRSEDGAGDGGVPPRRADPGHGDARRRRARVGHEDAELRGELRRGGRGGHGGRGGVQRERVHDGERRRGGPRARVGPAERRVREGLGGRRGGARAAVRRVGLLSGRGRGDAQRVGEQGVDEGLGVRGAGRRVPLPGLRGQGAVPARGLRQPLHRSLFVMACLLHQTGQDSMADRSG